MVLSTFDLLMLLGIGFMVIGIVRSGTLIKQMQEKNARERKREAHRQDQTPHH